MALRSSLFLAAWACACCVQAQVDSHVQAMTQSIVQACPGNFPAAPVANPIEAEEALAQLTPLSDLCENNGRYHAYRGALLLVLQRSSDAALALEKALLLDPDQPGAQLDFAQALGEVGQKSAARDLVREVLQRPDMQAELRSKLTQVNGQPPARAWRWSANLQSTLGYETNLTNATSAQALTLFLANGPVSIPLADTERPRSGSAIKLSAALEGAFPLVSGELRLSGAFTERNTDNRERADLSLLNAGAAYALPLEPGALLAGYALNQVTIGQQLSYEDTTLHFKYESSPAWAGCQWGPQLGVSSMRYPQAAILNGTYRFTRLELACGGELQQTRAIVTTGVDSPDDPTRPGGTRDRQELQLRHERIINASQLSLWARWSQTQDREIYSELLGNVKTETTSTSFGLGWWHPFSGGWSYGVELESTSQTSNNSLNNINNLSIYGGVRWQVR